MEEIPDADETLESLTSLMDSAMGIIGKDGLEENDVMSQNATESPILTPRKVCSYYD